jgi:hypothetical protein
MADQQLADGILAAAAVTPKPAADAEQVTQRREGDVLEARSTSRWIKTVEDLLAHIEADMSRYEIAASEATCWEGMTADRETGQPIVTPLHRVWVKLKPKAGPGIRECVEAMISAASLSRAKQKPIKPKARGDLWAVHVIADCHFGKYAWSKTTGGGDYDLDIAERLVGSSARQLLDISDSYSPARRTILFLGDLFHYDTPHGSTTSGTPLERDGRMPKMIEVGCDALLGVVERSAETRPTDVHVVSGNHDEALTFAFQRILQERFRNDARVTVADGVAAGFDPAAMKADRALPAVAAGALSGRSTRSSRRSKASSSSPASRAGPGPPRAWASSFGRSAGAAATAGACARAAAISGMRAERPTGSRSRSEASGSVTRSAGGASDR